MLPCSLGTGCSIAPLAARLEAGWVPVVVGGCVGGCCGGGGIVGGAAGAFATGGPLADGPTFCELCGVLIVPKDRGGANSLRYQSE